MKKNLFATMYPILLVALMSVNLASCISEDYFTFPEDTELQDTVTENNNAETDDTATDNEPADDEGDSSVTEDEELTDKSGVIDGYEAVDLGLPSRTLWAVHNVGATVPEEAGGYYAWGETEEKSEYTWDTYKYGNDAFAINKYCTDSNYGTVDNKTELDAEDDVAHAKWGGSWRMPTSTEFDELYEACDWEWATVNGVNGYRITGPNDNSIFLPAAGEREAANISGAGEYGYYWSASLYDGSCSGAYYFLVTGYYYYLSYYNRYFGFPVRPVCD